MPIGWRSIDALHYKGGNSYVHFHLTPDIKQLPPTWSKSENNSHYQVSAPRWPHISRSTEQKKEGLLSIVLNGGLTAGAGWNADTYPPELSILVPLERVLSVCYSSWVVCFSSELGRWPRDTGNISSNRSFFILYFTFRSFQKFQIKFRLFQNSFTDFWSRPHVIVIGIDFNWMIVLFIYKNWHLISLDFSFHYRMISLDCKVRLSVTCRFPIFFILILE